MSEIFNKCKDCQFFKTISKALGHTSRQTTIKNPKGSRVTAYICTKDNNPVSCNDFLQRVEFDSSSESREIHTNSCLSKYDERVLKIRRLKRRLAQMGINRGEPKVVERVKQRERLPQIEGLVEDVKKETKEFDEGPRDQYHVIIKPTSEDAIEYVSGSKTERFHSFVGISPSTKPDGIVEGSALDNFIQCIEGAMPEVKKLRTHEEVMNAIKGKTFVWVLKRLGKTYQGKESREQYVPQVLAGKRR